MRALAHRQRLDPSHTRPCQLGGVRQTVIQQHTQSLTDRSRQTIRQLPPNVCPQDRQRLVGGMLIASFPGQVLP